MTKARDLANAGTALTTVSATELGYLDGVTSAVQTQINAKATYPSQSGNSGKYLTTDGSNASWGAVSSSGLTLIDTQTFSAVSTKSLDNVFNSTYDSYKIVLTIDKSLSTGFTNMRLRASSSDNTTSNYYSLAKFDQVDGVGNGIQKTNAATGFTFNDAANLYATLDIYNPNKAAKTFIAGGQTLFTYSAAFYAGSFSGLFNTTTQFDGFTIYPDSGTLTGTIRVYGYKN